MTDEQYRTVRGTEIKAITYSQMSIVERDDGHTTIVFIPDI